MSISERSRSARIRSKATGQGYQHLLEHPDEHATPAQRDLESVFFGSLQSLRYVPPRAGEPLASRYSIVRIDPQSESLTVQFGVAIDVRTLADCILPALPRHGGEISGIPGLRKREHESGTSLYRPGQAGEIVIAGVQPEDLSATLNDGTKRPADESPAAWTREERIFAKENAQTLRGLDIESALMRRIGLLNATAAYGIQSWRSRPIELVIELAFEMDVTRELTESLRDEMTSMHLAPRLILDFYEAPRAEAPHSTMHFTLMDTPQTAELRLTTRPRRVDR